MTLIEKTTALSTVIKNQAELMVSSTIDKLQVLIADKRAAKQMFQEEKSYFELELNKVRERLGSLPPPSHRSINNCHQLEVYHKVKLLYLFFLFVSLNCPGLKSAFSRNIHKLKHRICNTNNINTNVILHTDFIFQVN